MEELIDVLEKENHEYEKLLELSMKKSGIIAGRDIAQLEKIKDSKREEVTRDIANVINKDVEELKLSVLVELMGRQPEEQKRLAKVHDKLKETVRQVRTINESNQELINQSLEMVQFDLNLLRSMRQAPQTNNYGRDAVSSGGTLGSVRGFDAKQ